MLTRRGDQLRNSRKMNWQVGALVGLLAIGALGAGLLLRPWSSESTAEARGPAGVSSHSPAQGSNTGGAPVSVVAASQLESESSQSQSVGGIQLTATNFRAEGNKVLADVCFDMPDGSDWTIWRASLVYPRGVLETFGLMLMERREPSVDGEQRVNRFVSGRKEESVVEVSGDVPGKRCDTLFFDLPGRPSRSGQTIHVQSIAAQPREGESCSAANLEKVQRALDARSPGIVISCQLGNVGEGVTLGAWPAELSRSQAEEILYGEDLFLDVYGRRGPWVFNVNLP